MARCEGNYSHFEEANKASTVNVYGNDTGLFPEETYAYLQNVKLDLVSLDCTHGARHAGGWGHLGLETCV